ncbi:hypothetical protein [Seleniivibrio woodruffii]|uniref:hypothetical protein n=1 Tax=Seleniivibrio woodruffii TaxID=1078050 RepID=UPI0026EFD53A|nr:hypothetical protein [Seleniivibrio woodruffii]
MKKTGVFFLLGAVLLFVTAACGGGGGSASPTTEGTVTYPLLSKSVKNEAAFIPSQCYTVTEGENGEKFNPCYSCHKNSVEPNYTNDDDLQETYTFAEYANTNHWTNLFVDRTEAVVAQSDSEILSYVRQDNYKSSDGKIILAEKLKSVPKEWDFDGDGSWGGYTPDCYFNFDSEGFDKNPSGGYTGWRAYAYAPFLGTFWPTNGSTDDVLIRLSDIFMKDEGGSFSLDVYKINLAIVESLIKKKDIAIDPVDETVYGVDLDKNGSLGTASVIEYDWLPTAGRYMYYVGLAKTKLAAGEVHLAAGLFPEGTEFLHSVRYINVTDGGDIDIAPRMKELRYSKKLMWMTYSDLEYEAYDEFKEEYDFPDRLSVYYGDIEYGLSNPQGWVFQAFIEDAKGDLRPQTYEETVFCMGCHTRLGATSDTVFTYSRKYEDSSNKRGWFHWTQKSIKGMPEHKVAYEGKGDQYEYTMYLQQNIAGDEFRDNDEVKAKFFNADGTLKTDMVNALHSDVSVLLFPSSARALTLNKAYRTIVKEQSFVYGRDANVKPVTNVHKTISPQDKPTGLTDFILSTATSLIF